MSIALSIVFTGLCELVTGGDRKPAKVLLVDARGVGAVDGVTLPAHVPTLVARLATLANAETSAPTRVVGGGLGRGAVDQIGLWDLTGSEVRIRVSGREATGVQFYRPAAGATSWPNPPRDMNDPSAWRDLRYLASMDVLTGDGRIDPALIGADHSPPGALPRSVAARVHLDAGTIEAGMPSLEIHRDDVFEFRSVGGEPAHRQALTDTLRWALEVDTTAVAIEIVPSEGGPIKRLVLAPSAAPHEVFISNLPAENVPHDAHRAVGDEEMGVLHFGAYYDLLRNKPGTRPLPWLWHAERGRKGAGLVSRPLCSTAWFRAR